MAKQKTDLNIAKIEKTKNWTCGARNRYEHY